MPGNYNEFDRHKGFVTFAAVFLSVFGIFVFLLPDISSLK